MAQQVHVLPLAAVSVGHLIVDMYLGGFPVLFPILQETYGLSYAQIGFLIFLAQFTSSVLQPVFGLISDKFAVRSVLQVGLGLSALGLALIVLAPNYGVVLIGTTICGLGVAAYHPEASRLAVLAGRDRQSTAMSAFSVSGNIGLALGPGIMTFGLATLGGDGSLSMRGALVYVPITLLVIGFVHIGRNALTTYRPTGAAADSGTPGDLLTPETTQHAAVAGLPSEKRHWLSGPWPTHYRWMAMLLVYIFIRSTAHTGMQTLIPLYYQGSTAGATMVSSSLLTAFLVGGAVGTVVGGMLADVFGTRAVAIASFVLSPVLFAVLPYVGEGALSFTLMFVSGLTLIASFSLTTVLGQRFLPANAGLASGLTLGFSVGTGGAGAALLGIIADAWGLESSFWAMAVLLGLGLVFAFSLPQDRTVDLYFKNKKA